MWKENRCRVESGGQGDVGRGTWDVGHGTWDVGTVQNSGFEN